MGADAARRRHPRPGKRDQPGELRPTPSAPAPRRWSPTAPRPATTPASRTTTTTSRARRRSSTTPTPRRRPFSCWPKYPGLLDRAQQPFAAAGLERSLLRHLRQPRRRSCRATRPPTRRFERVATGCVKPISPAVSDPDTFAGALAALDPATLQQLLTTDPTSVALVPPDPQRQYVSKAQYKAVFEAGTQSDGHGFASSTRRRRPPRTAPPATTRGARGRGSGSSPSTPSRRAASPAPRRTATSTTRSSSGCGASSRTAPAGTSSWSCSAITRSRA